jgi:hypothetical protein
MAPVVVFLEDDWEIPEQPPAEEWEMPQASGKDWDSELLVPAQGRLVYVGQAQAQFVHFHEPTPGMLWPKKTRRKRKKKTTSLKPPPEPAPLPPAPIDWLDWEERCQELCQAEDWEEICPPAPREDWDAEIAASQDKEDWDAEIVASQ